MQDFAFYNVGCHDAKGPRGLLVLVRRGLRRILRPIFLRQVELFRYLADQIEAHEHRIFAGKVEGEAAKARLNALDGRHDELAARQDQFAARQEELAEQVQTTIAFGWDYVALVRRLATLEDQIAAMGAPGATGSDEGDTHPSILFPGIEKASRQIGLDQEGQPARSKVC